MKFSSSLFAVALFTSAVALGTLSPDSAHAQASFEILPFSDSFEDVDMDALDLSADGRIVLGRGRRYINDLGGFQLIPSRWDVGVGITSLEEQGPGRSDSPQGISADGSTIVGRFTTDPLATSGSAAILRDGQAFSISDVPGSTALDVSGDGSVVVGGLAPVYLSPGQGGYVWDEVNGMRSMADLTGIDGLISAHAISDDGSRIVGTTVADVDNPFSNQAYSWTESGGYLELDQPVGRDVSRALGISGDGSTVFGFAVPSVFPAFRAVHWDEEGTVTDIPDGEYTTEFGERFPPSPLEAGFAEAASYDGSVIVGYGSAVGESVAWIHDQETDETVAIRDLLVSLGASGLDDWNLTQAIDISADGRVITGWAERRLLAPPLPFPRTNSAYYPFRAVIPEPSAALLVCLGLLGLAGCRSGER